MHYAVNCASIGCPALRDEAFVAERLDAQLDDGVRRFLGDRREEAGAESGAAPGNPISDPSSDLRIYGIGAQMLKGFFRRVRPG